MEKGKEETALEEALREALRYPAPVSIVTVGDDGSHLAGVWNSEVLVLDLGTIIVPAGRLVKTEKNVSEGSDVKMLLASPGTDGGAGSGFRVTGRAEFHSSGPQYELVRSMFRWARAAMVISVDRLEQLT